MSRKKVGLALGSGAARGLAHIGVLEVLQKEGIPIDMIAGTSMGAIIGAAYLQSNDINLLKKMAMDIRHRRFEFITSLTLSRTGVFNTKRVENWLKTNIGEINIEDLKVPFACVAVDIDNGEEVVIKEGPVWEVVRASSAIPVVFALKRYQGRYLVDGTIRNAVPVNVAREMGADIVIAVNVLRNAVDIMDHKLMKKVKEPNIITVALKTMYIFGYQGIESSVVGADVVIEPKLTRIAYTDFHKAEECIEAGKQAAQNAIPEIKEKLALL